ncbi:GAF domain-containing protein [Bradyrhizobium sp. dw_411]|uniref:GAF domain-containing protein n=1 Tax=Bradyrhizobium sp. dw_411 TaxID=2720082 RepID=UPI00201BD874|nr:GAF domain-containing protein [Bradyrhizobium sp. dw_411]
MAERGRKAKKRAMATKRKKAALKPKKSIKSKSIKSKSTVSKSTVSKSLASKSPTSKSIKPASSKSKSENARLKSELRTARDRQAASAEVMRLISASPGDADQTLRRIAEITERLFDASSVTLLIADGERWGQTIRVGAGSERITTAIPLAHVAITLQFMPGTVYLENRQVHVADLDDPAAIARWPGVTPARAAGSRTMSGTPLRREGGSIGALIVHRARLAPFTEDELALLQSFADQAAIAIENARLFNETREALERQTATADILKVIASSPSDVQPVFEAIAASSNRLIGGFSTAVLRFVGEDLHLAAFTPIDPRTDAALKGAFPAPLSEFPLFRAVRGGETQQFSDTESEDVPPQQRALARLRGYRSMLFTPLMNGDKPIGMISVTRKDPGTFAAHYVQLVRTFADQAVIAIENVRLFDEVQDRTRKLAASLDELRTAQDRLIQTEKLASLGQLTAGIAHEIKNPLNFVNNFSALSAELIDELNDVLKPAALDGKVREEIDELTQMLKGNLEKVVQHGKRADSIVKNMLLHSREGSGEQRSVDINAILDESLNLAYHGARAEKPGFNITLQRDFDAGVAAIDAFPQEITRVFLNLITNGFYAAAKRKSQTGDSGFEPVLRATTRSIGHAVEIRIRDNGTGIPADVKDKIFNPFFTTKPAGEGTGLGLSMSHDIIVKQHGGSIDVTTEPGQFTEFTVVLPIGKT